MTHAALLSVHLLAVIVWLGGGFYELYLGRMLLRSDGSSAEAALTRAIHRSGFVIFGATLVAFAAGAAMTIVLDLGFFTQFWLGLKQAIAVAILLIVSGIFPTALRLGQAIEALPPGDGPVPVPLKQLYARLEPWYTLMRVLGVVAVLLAAFRPGTPT